ncbi:glycosyltransferase family 4 protein [Bacteroidota bacterium]
MKQYNFIFLIPNTAFGGLEIQMVNRAVDAVEMGHNSLFISLEGSRVEKYALEKNLKVESLNINVRYVDFLAAFKLGRLMKQNSIDVCVVGKSDYLSIATIARNIFSKKTAIIYYQQLEAQMSKKDIFHNWVYKNLDAAVVLTDVMKKKLPECTVFDNNKIAVIPYGLHLNQFDPANHNKIENRKKFNLPVEKFLIGLPGRITETKGQAIAIKAFSKAKIPDSQIVLCGDNGNNEGLNRLKALAKSVCVYEDLIYVPFTFEMPAFMNAMDISILPSLREAFGLVVIEAMASGLPVIATNAGGVPEIIIHKQNGLLFEPFDIDTLAQYMKLLAKDRKLREKLGKQARIDSETRYDYINQSGKFFNYVIDMYKNRNKLN